MKAQIEKSIFGHIKSIKVAGKKYAVEDIEKAELLSQSKRWDKSLKITFVFLTAIFWFVPFLNLLLLCCIFMAGNNVTLTDCKITFKNGQKAIASFEKHQHNQLNQLLTI